LRPQRSRALRYAGSEPTQIALSSDSKYLYVGLNGSGSVQRLDLPGFTPDIDVSLGTDDYGDENLALSLAVIPGSSQEWAVAEGSSGCCGTSGLYFFNNSTQLPDSITYPYIDQIVFADATTAYGYDQDYLTQIGVSSSGGTAGTEWDDLLTGSQISYSGGLVYDNEGHAFNPATGLIVGTFDLGGNGCCYYSEILPDAGINRLFSLGTSPFLSNSFAIASYNLTKFVPIALLNLSQLNSTTAGNTFLSWGNAGLAFTLETGCCETTSYETVLVQSPSMLGTAGINKNPPPITSSLSPASVTHGSWNFPLTVQGSGFVPGSTVTWNGTSLFASRVSSTQLTVYVPAGVIASAGTAQLVVTNPGPGGGVSTPLTFTIN